MIKCCLASNKYISAISMTKIRLKPIYNIGKDDTERGYDGRKCKLQQEKRDVTLGIQRLTKVLSLQASAHWVLLQVVVNVEGEWHFLNSMHSY